MEKILGTILEKLESLEVGQKKLEAGQTALEMGQKKLEAGQTALEVRQKALEVGQKESKQILDAVIHNLEVNNAKLEALTMDVHQIKGDVTVLKEGQQEQQKILERLSVRSIAHEADIVELRRTK